MVEESTVLEVWVHGFRGLGFRIRKIWVLRFRNLWVSCHGL